MPKLTRTINNKLKTVNAHKSFMFKVSSFKFKPAFTLIELLIVIALIGILSSFGVYSYQSSQIKARDTQRKSDLDAIKKALETFTSDTAGAAKYPNTTTGSLVQGDYIKTLPKDPKTKIDYIYSARDKNGNTNCAPLGGDIPVTIPPSTFGASDGNCSTFTLTACLEVNNDTGKNTLPKPSSEDGSTCPGDVGTSRIYQITSQ